MLPLAQLRPLVMPKRKLSKRELQLPPDFEELDEPPQLLREEA
jgi:hypothetical protein